MHCRAAPSDSSSEALRGEARELLWCRITWTRTRWWWWIFGAWVRGARRGAQGRRRILSRELACAQAGQPCPRDCALDGAALRRALDGARAPAFCSRTIQASGRPIWTNSWPHRWGSRTFRSGQAAPAVNLDAQVLPCAAGWPRPLGLVRRSAHPGLARPCQAGWSLLFRLLSGPADAPPQPCPTLRAADAPRGRKYGFVGESWLACAHLGLDCHEFPSVSSRACAWDRL